MQTVTGGGSAQCIIRGCQLPTLGFILVLPAPQPKGLGAHVMVPSVSGYSPTQNPKL